MSQPLATGSPAPRYAPGSWQVPTTGSSSPGQPPTVVDVALARGDVVTATCTSLPTSAPAVASEVHEQPALLASGLLESLRCTPTQRSAADVTLVAARPASASRSHDDGTHATATTRPIRRSSGRPRPCSTRRRPLPRRQHGRPRGSQGCFVVLPTAMLVLLVVGALYSLVRALDTASTRWVTLAGVLIGLGSTTKMGEALLVVPASGLTHLIAAPIAVRRRVTDLLGAGVAMVAAAGWYIAIVDLWPAGGRPYIGGSTTNSLLELALGYHGLGRLPDARPAPGRCRGRTGPLLDRR